MNSKKIQVEKQVFLNDNINENRLNQKQIEFDRNSNNDDFKNILPSIQQSICEAFMFQNLIPALALQVNDLNLEEKKNLDQKIIQENYNNQISISDLDDETEEEFSIWNEDELQKSGINTEKFIDSKGSHLKFYQIYRLRSILYQPQYISRIKTIQEVQTLYSHFNKNISLNNLKQQQDYLDLYCDIQKKDYYPAQQSKQQLVRINQTNKNKKSNSEKEIKINQQICEKNAILTAKQQQKKNFVLSQAQPPKKQKQKIKDIQSTNKKRQELVHQQNQFLDKNNDQIQQNESKKIIDIYQNDVFNFDCQAQNDSFDYIYKENGINKQNIDSLASQNSTYKNQLQQTEKLNINQSLNLIESDIKEDSQKKELFSDNDQKQQVIPKIACSIFSFFKKMISSHLNNNH